MGGSNEGDPLARTPLGKTPKWHRTTILRSLRRPGLPRTRVAESWKALPSCRQRLPCRAVEPSDGRGRKAIFHRRLHRGVHAIRGGSPQSRSGFDEERFRAPATLIYLLEGRFRRRQTGSYGRTSAFFEVGSLARPQPQRIEECRRRGTSFLFWGWSILRTPNPRR